MAKQEKNIPIPKRKAEELGLDTLEVKGSIVVGDYTRERMMYVGSIITSYKRRKNKKKENINDKKMFTMRKVIEGGKGVIRLWRTA